MSRQIGYSLSLADINQVLIIRCSLWGTYGSLRWDPWPPKASRLDKKHTKLTTIPSGTLVLSELETSVVWPEQRVCVRGFVRGLECLGHEVGFCSGGCGEPLKSEGKTNKLLEDSEQKTELFSDTKYNCPSRYSVERHVVCQG